MVLTPNITLQYRPRSKKCMYDRFAENKVIESSLMIVQVEDEVFITALHYIKQYLNRWRIHYYQ